VARFVALDSDKNGFNEAAGKRVLAVWQSDIEP